MPMSMNDLERTYRRTYRRLTIGICVIYGASVLAGLATLVGNAKIAGQVSQALHAEFVSPDVASAPEPTRLARPAERFLTVKAD
jgi:hypothetical protein